MGYTTKYYLELNGPQDKESKAKLRDFLKVTGYIDCYNKWDSNTFYDEDAEVGGLSLLFPEWTFKLTSIGEDFLRSHKEGYVDVRQTHYHNGNKADCSLGFVGNGGWLQNNEANAKLVQDKYDENLAELKDEQAEAELKKSALDKLTPKERLALGLQ